MFKKRISKTINHENSEYIPKDILIKVICRVIEGKPAKLTSHDCECNDIVIKWNEMIDSIFEDRKKTILAVNNVLEMITKMNSVRDMIKSVSIQTQDLHSMSASSEELSASIEDVSNMSQKVSENSNEAKKITEDGVKNISNSIKFVKKSFDDIDIIDKRMQV